MSVELAREGDAIVLTLNRPQALNALSFSVLEQISDAIDEVAASDARVLIVTGAGDKAFCAGADIKELRERTLLAHKRGAELGQYTFDKLSKLSIPSLACINGYAFGGGLELAMACDFRIASTNAKMGLPEIKLGILPGIGGSQRLAKSIGKALAMDLILTGRTIDVHEAKSAGIVSRVVPSGELLQTAIEAAHQIAGLNAPAVIMAKEAVNRAFETSLSEGVLHERRLFHGDVSFQLVAPSVLRALAICTFSM